MAPSIWDAEPATPNMKSSGTNGYQQVGYGSNTNNGSYSEALVWTGTAASAVDLDAFLPPAGSWEYALAYSIDSSGNIYGEAGGRYDGMTGDFAVEWSPIPEPTSLLLTIITSSCLFARRWRKIH